ncbi:MAG: dihydropteroate synthase [Burkholderiales bacterium]|nr:MAG: dihydropteroate synthase [Burkholderiales bacterium]
MNRFLRCGGFTLDLSRPLVMGVVNVTPDSFSDGGRYLSAQAAIDHARRLVEEGADLLDIGGESSRPGAEPVPVEEELRRVMPVLEAVVALGVPVSVDTMKPQVMRAAIGVGAAMVNDILALRAPGALEAVAGSDVAVCLMHMQGEPRTMQVNPTYGDVVREVRDFLAERWRPPRRRASNAAASWWIPALVSARTAPTTWRYSADLPVFAALGVPVLVGLSRKSVLGRLTGRDVNERLAASLAAAVLAVERGAHIVRVHDVAATRDALAVLAAVTGAA